MIYDVKELDYILIRKSWKYTKPRYFFVRGSRVKLEDTFFDKRGLKQLFVCSTVDNLEANFGNGMIYTF